MAKKNIKSVKPKRVIKISDLTNVEIISASTERVQTVKKDHAERIFKLRRSDWSLVSDSPFQINADGIIELAGKGTPQESEE